MRTAAILAGAIRPIDPRAIGWPTLALALAKIDTNLRKNLEGDCRASADRGNSQPPERRFPARTEVAHVEKRWKEFRYAKAKELGATIT